MVFSQASYLGLHSELILSTYTLPSNKLATFFELAWELRIVTQLQ